MPTILEELRRRNVLKVGAAYAAAVWLIAQIAETVLPVFELPDALLRILFILLGLGFPVTIILAWIYDLTPQGVRRTDDLADGAPRVSGQGLNVVIVGCLSVALLFLVLDRFVWNPVTDTTVTSIAVLPFEVEPPDVETLYLGSGIADSLVTRLSRLPQLSVKSRSAFGAGPGNLLAIGEQMKVGAICRGSVSRRNNLLEIAVELVRVVDGTILWSDRLIRNFSNLASLESDVSAEIAAVLSIELSAEEAAILARPPTENAEAYRLYLQGRHFWNQRSQSALRQSVELYRQAVDLDPAYALAWSGLADSYLMLFAWGVESPEDVAPLALGTAQRAAQLDPSLAEPWATIGYYKTLYERDWDGAEVAFQKSLELNRNYSTAHHWYAFYLSTIGDSKAALEEVLLARDAEPLSPVINGEVGMFFVYDEQYERAIEEMRPAQLWNPDFPSLLMSLSRAHAMLGHHEEASSMVDILDSYFRENYLARGYISAVLVPIGREDDARAFYEEALAASESSYIAPGVLGFVAASIGDHDAAFRHFEEGLEQRSLVVSWLRDPLIAGIRQDARYAALMRRIGLDP